MITLLIATRNAHKVEEIRAILGERFQYLTLRDFPNAPKVREGAAAFAGNAARKAVGLARWLAAGGGGKSRRPARGEFFVLADDSGLEVDALGGAPGVHSARFAALDRGRPDNSASAENNAKLLRLLKDVPPEKGTASPACPANEPGLLTELFEGACEGWIALARRGRGGFGYDPLFVPAGYDETFAELGEELKNQLSHRARALAKLKRRLEGKSAGRRPKPSER